jgi:hypothetical protein
MAPSGFNINKRGIEQFTREIQREFDKHPIRMPVTVDREGLQPTSAAGPTNYYGPVINVHGDRAQLAWGNESVVQNQVQSEQQIAPGFEAIAQAVVSTLRELAGAGLEADDQQAAEVAAQEVLAEVVKDDPDRGVVKRGVMMLKGLLSPVALGMSTGAADGAQEWARTAVEQLGHPF